MTTEQAVSFLHSRLDERFGKGESSAMIRIIFEEIMNYGSVDLVLRAKSELPDFVPAKLEQIVARLLQNEPLQYILGTALFHGHKFRVTPHTLIPRPETEQLVDIIIDENRDSDLRVLDIGTGSGCIAISLALALKFAVVSATDISAEALSVASENALTLKAKVNFIQNDILQGNLNIDGELDLIVSNPPYITGSEKAGMEPNVLLYEPGTALFVPDDDPLLYYRAIARFATTTLRRGGRLYLECNRRFAHDVQRMLQKMGFVAQTVIDQFGNPRFVTAEKC
ncbi:MAG: peptide chain release factor N(5)-glutamine methyltransferase [Muribaculaceae bacterium]|nr:peptide chain release factor N(5)-glutamine methyltransferase [Muribaculaceae bacterium]